MTNIKLKAKEILGYMVHKVRDNGQGFYCLTNDAPQWVTDFVHVVHGDMMPDDYKYQFIHEAVEFLCDNDNEDDLQQSAEGAIYNHERLQWLASNAERPYIVDETVQEFGLADSKDFNVLDLINQGYVWEQCDVYRTVFDELQKMVEGA